MEIVDFLIDWGQLLLKAFCLDVWRNRLGVALGSLVDDVDPAEVHSLPIRVQISKLITCLFHLNIQNLRQLFVPYRLLHHLRIIFKILKRLTETVIAL